MLPKKLHPLTRLRRFKKKAKVVEFPEEKGGLHPFFWILLALVFLYGIIFLGTKLF